MLGLIESCLKHGDGRRAPSSPSRPATLGVCAPSFPRKGLIILGHPRLVCTLTAHSAVSQSVSQAEWCAPSARGVDLTNRVNTERVNRFAQCSGIPDESESKCSRQMLVRPVSVVQGESSWMRYNPSTHSLTRKHVCYKQVLPIHSAAHSLHDTTCLLHVGVRGQTTTGFRVR